MSAAIEVSGLVKRHRGFSLGPLDLRVEAGRALALIGPNGAGKTTLMDLLAGISRSTSGHVRVFGSSQGPLSSRRNAYVGYATDNQPFFENWTGRRNLEFIAGFYPGWSSGLEARLVQRLEVQLDKKVSTLSRGNRVKLALVSALAKQPRLLLLDEPTSGLDPLVRSEVLDVLFEFLGNEGPTLVYSTHILSDVSRLADELTFIRAGRLVMQTERDDLEANWRRLTFRTDLQSLPAATAQLLSEHQVQGSLHRAITHDFGRLEDQLRALGASQLAANRMSLEEISVQILKAGMPATIGNTRETPAGAHA